MKPFTALLVGLALLWQADHASAQVTINWNESVNGPLSIHANSPTSLGSFGVGTNTIIGARERNGGTTTNDYFTFSVSSETQVGSIILGTDLRILVWIGDGTSGETLGYSFTSQNGNLLPQFGLTEISAGTYLFYVSNDNLGGGFSAANYSLNYIVQPIPEPTTMSLFLLGVGLVLLARKAR